MEWDDLVSALSQHGIRFLTFENEVRDIDLVPDDLIRELALHPHPRLHLALTSLFLLHPDYHASCRMCCPLLTARLKSNYKRAIKPQFICSTCGKRG